MADEPEPLQVNEVVTAVSRDQACAIVHPRTRQEVDLYTDIYNQKEPWRIRTLFFNEIPEKEVLRPALALGFQLRSHQNHINFGPRRGEVVTFYELYRNCFGITAAAIKALALARLLPGVGAD